MSCQQLVQSKVGGNECQTQILTDIMQVQLKYEGEAWALQIYENYWRKVTILPK